MNYSTENFTGEINLNLTSEYKIPLKTKTNVTHNISEITNVVCFTSPLDNAVEEYQHKELTTCGFNKNTRNSKQLIKRSINKCDQIICEPNATSRSIVVNETIMPNTGLLLSSDQLSNEYPDEMKKLMSPLFCDVCFISLDCKTNANIHYASKNHERKINSWLQSWSRRTGQPLAKLVKVDEDTTDFTTKHPFYCKICDLTLTSIQHARGHYRGRKHRSTVAGRTKPKGVGYYDLNGKWNKCKKIKTDASNRFGIGQSFIEPKMKLKEIEKIASIEDDKYCKMCNIWVSHELIMQQHLNGAKHKKRIKDFGNLPANSNNNILLTIQNLKDNGQPNDDISIYRTPTGNYYCKICDKYAMEATFRQHLISKKHLNKNKLNACLRKAGAIQ